MTNPRKRRYCNCGRRVEKDNSTFHCKSCTAYNEERCKKPQLEHKQITILPEFRVFFKHTAISDLFETAEEQLSGCYMEKPDRTWSIHLYLNRSDMIAPDVLHNIARTISHEYLHMAIAFAFDNHAEGFKANKQSDKGLMKRLANEGYFG